MCTAINFLDQANETVFGRTMDFYAILDPHLVSFPAGASWETMLGQTLADQYGVGGIGRHAQHRYVLFDGVNEMGLAGGALYFKGYADFPQPSKHSGQVQLSALDFLHYALGSCASLDDIRERLADLTLVGIQDGLTGTVAPMHWMFTDLSGRGLVVEQTALGLHIYENPAQIFPGR